MYCMASSDYSIFIVIFKLFIHQKKFNDPFGIFKLFLILTKTSSYYLFYVSLRYSLICILL
jgi:hypothetical protein